MLRQIFKFCQVMEFPDLGCVPSKDKVKVGRDPTVNLNKKLSNAIAALTKAEKKKWEELIQSEASTNVFAFHFGTGCEDDYTTLRQFLQHFGKFKLQLYPVKNYAFVEFEEINYSKALMDSLTSEANVKYTNLLYANKERATMFFYSRVGPNEIAQAMPTDIPNAAYDVSIPGLRLIKDFLSVEEEQSILAAIDAQEWTKLNQRRVQHYGFDFIYGANTVETEKPASKPIPQFLDGVSSRVSDLFEGKQDPVDQLTVNEYQPGMGIPPHFDVHPPFKEMFVSISLLSGLVMSFKSYKGEEHHLYLPPRSCVLFSGEVRYAWFHSIATRKMDKVEGEMHFRRRRLSLTFRTIQRDYKCKCQWPFFCESQGYDPVKMKSENPLLTQYLNHNNLLPQGKSNTQSSKNVPNMSQEEHLMMQSVEKCNETTPTDIEKKYVYEIYEKIAPHFSSTRYKPWPKIEQFLNNLDQESLVADVGCGNGKYLPINRENIHMIGTDRSENLIQICRDKDQQFQVFTADSLKLPLRSGGFDAVISIAVIHHFSNKFLRQAAIRELQRIVRLGGQILIYVWAFEQEEKQFTEQDVFVPWNLQFKFEDKEKLEQQEEAKDQTGVNDYHINEEKKTVVYKRYYHMFKKGEIEELILEIPGLSIEQSYYDHANWVVILRKFSD